MGAYRSHRSRFPLANVGVEVLFGVEKGLEVSHLGHVPGVDVAVTGPPLLDPLVHRRPDGAVRQLGGDGRVPRRERGEQQPRGGEQPAGDVARHGGWVGHQVGADSGRRRVRVCVRCRGACACVAGVSGGGFRQRRSACTEGRTGTVCAHGGSARWSWWRAYLAKAATTIMMCVCLCCGSSCANPTLGVFTSHTLY